MATKKKLGQYIQQDNEDDVFSLEDRPLQTELPKAKKPAEPKSRGMLEKKKMHRDETGAMTLTPPDDDDSVVFKDKKRGPYLVQRNGLDDEKWKQFVDDAKKNPDYDSTYSKGEEVHSGYVGARMISPERGESEVSAPDDDDSVSFSSKRDGPYVVARNKTSKEKWDSYVAKSKEDPDYVSTYESGKEVDRKGALTGDQHLADNKKNWTTQPQSAEEAASARQANDARVQKEGGGAGPAAFLRRSVVDATKGAIPQNAETGYGAAPAASSGSGVGDAAKAVGKTLLQGATSPISVPLQAVDDVMGAKLGPTVQNLGAAAGSMAQSGLNTVGEGLTSAGMPNLGAAAQGVAGAIHPQPNLSGLPPMMRPGAQGAVDQANGVQPSAGLPDMKGGAVPPPTPMSESESMSLKLKGPMGAAAPMPVDVPGGDQTQMNQAFDDFKVANKAAFEAQSIKDKETDSLRREQIARQERFEADQVEKQNLIREHIENAQHAHNNVIMQLEKPIARIDPSRYWSSRGSAHGALTVLAGFLSGMAGKGGEFLGRLDSLVNEDVKQQQMDIENRAQNLHQQEGATRTAYGMARDAGLDQAAAAVTAKDAMYKMFQLQLQAQIEAVPDPVKRAQLMQANMQIEQQRAKYQADFKNAVSEQTFRKAQEYGIYQHARNEAAEIEVKRAKAQKGIKEDKMPPGEQAKISGASQGLKLLPALQQAVGSGNWTDAAIDEVMKRLPGTNAAARNSEAQFLGRTIFSNLDRSVVMAADQKFLDKLVSGVGFGSLSQGDIAAFRRILKSQRNATIDTADQLGQQTGELQQEPEGEVPGERAR